MPKKQGIDLSSPTKARHSIYIICEEGSDQPVYVGQTTYDRDGTRFQEHIRDDVTKTWHYQQHSDGAYGNPNADLWPFRPYKKWDCKDFTNLEVAASEQYYWEEYGGLDGELTQNSKQPLTLKTFIKYKNMPGTWTGLVNFPGGWSPKK
jgi:hypothetical protein